MKSIDSELRLVVALRRAARERRGLLPSIDVVDALLDECLRADPEGYNPAREFSQIPTGLGAAALAIARILDNAGVATTRRPLGGQERKN
jgi:hypothetical protein